MLCCGELLCLSKSARHLDDAAVSRGALRGQVLPSCTRDCHLDCCSRLEDDRRLQSAAVFCADVDVPLAALA